MNIFKIIIVVIFLAGCGENKDSNAAKRELVPNPEGNKQGSFILPQSDTIPGVVKSGNKYYPFKLLEIEGKYQITAPIEGPELYPKYYTFFKKYQYEGNGYCWEGHITQILEKLDNKLLKHINFDSEGGTFFAIADSKINQIKFIELLSPIFSDLKKLDVWVKKADRSRIDD